MRFIFFQNKKGLSEAQELSSYITEMKKFLEERNVTVIVKGLEQFYKYVVKLLTMNEVMTFCIVEELTLLTL